MNRQIKNWEKTYDVIVAGGGLSGVAAAIGAAREGLEVMLLEQYGCLGGMAVTALVNPFMAYCSKYGEGEQFDWNQIANAGIFLDIIRRLDKKGGMHSNRMTFHEEILKVVLDEMVNQYNVKVMFHCFVVDVEREDNRLKSVITVSKAGIHRFSGKIFIDATGDADMASLAGCPYTVGNEEGFAQPMTLCFRAMNVDTNMYAPLWGWYDNSYKGDSEECAKIVNENYKKEKLNGNIKNPLDGVSTFASCLPGVIHFNSTRVQGVTPMDIEGMSHAEMEGRKQAFELYNFMKGKAPGFENSSYMASGIQIGVRESRRIIGDYILTEDDIMNCVKFKDSIARGTYCIDIHSVKPGDKNSGMKDIPYGDYYTIPYSVLLPQKIENLIMAGRALSSTHLAHGSHRVMPISTCVGEAAGIASAIAVKDGKALRKISIPKLQDLLTEHGALY